MHCVLFPSVTLLPNYFFQITRFAFELQLDDYNIELNLTSHIKEIWSKIEFVSLFLSPF